VDKILPWTMIVLSAGAGVVYACSGKWRNAIYWLAASVLSWAVAGMR